MVAVSWSSFIKMGSAICIFFLYTRETCFGDNSAKR